MRQLDIPGSVLREGIKAALAQMGAGLTDGVTIGGVVGVLPDGNTVLLSSARVTLVAPPPPSTAGIRLVAANGERL